jgi:hypothetical protein
MNMKKIFFALLSLAFIDAQAQTLTADEVIQKYTAAMGGLDNFNKIKTAKLSGTVSTQGMDLPITVQIINGKAMRNDVEVMGQSVINVYNDGKAWKINPFAGAATATDVTGPELNEFKSQTNLASQLMDYKKRGYMVELSGQEVIEGANTYKLKLTGDDKKETVYFIDSKTFLPIKSVSKVQATGQEVEVENYNSDFKEFGGAKFAMTRIRKAQGQVVQEIKLDKVELDVAIDEKIFNKQ